MCQGEKHNFALSTDLTWVTIYVDFCSDEDRDSWGGYEMDDVGVGPSDRMEPIEQGQHLHKLTCHVLLGKLHIVLLILHRHSYGNLCRTAGPPATVLHCSRPAIAAAHGSHMQEARLPIIHYCPKGHNRNGGDSHSPMCYWTHIHLGIISTAVATKWNQYLHIQLFPTVIRVAVRK